MGDFSVERSFAGHNGTIAGLAFSPDGKKAVSGAYAHQKFDRDGRLWQLPLGLEGTVLRGHQAGIFSAVFSPYGDVIATGGGGCVSDGKWLYDSAIRLWDDQGTELLKFGDDLFFTYSLAFSPDGKLLLSGSGNHAPKAPGGRGSCCRLWDIATGQDVHHFGIHKSAVRCVSFSPDGKYVVAGSSGLQQNGVFAQINHSLTPFELRTIRIWESATKTELDLVAHQGWVNSLYFTPDSQFLLSAGQGVMLWHVNSGEKTKQFGADNNDAFVNCATISPHGSFVVVGTGGRLEPGAPYENCYVRLYDLSSGKEIRYWQTINPVTAVAVSPDEHSILAGGEHGELHFWPIN